jgi:glycerol uptake facilitator-like aquaporin
MSGVMTAVLARSLLAEVLGTALLVAVIVGSGIAASVLSTDPGLRLLENGIATALGLGVLILMFGPVSGAHFNPVVSLVNWAIGRREGTGPRLSHAAAYCGAQIVGAVGGAELANAMFGVAPALASTERATWPHVLAEVVAAAGLVLLILSLARTGRGAASAAAVGAYIGAAYWFTSSTSFANPAVTLGRMFSDTLSGIAPASVLPFIGAQLVGGALGAFVALLLFPNVGRAAGVVVVPHPAPD